MGRLSSQGVESAHAIQERLRAHQQTAHDRDRPYRGWIHGIWPSALVLPQYPLRKDAPRFAGGEQ